MSRFITDLGPGDHTLIHEPSNEITTLGRYAVWASAAAYRKAEVLEVSGDLEALQAKYGPNLTIYGVERGSTPA